MARGVNHCLYCGQRLHWHNDKGWVTVLEGTKVCTSPESRAHDHSKHRLAPA